MRSPSTTSSAAFYSDDHRRLLDRISEQAAAAISNSIVFEQTREASLSDALTGLPNTRYMVSHIARELARAERHGSQVAILVLDLDDFKKINDTHGHHVGDRALREVARVLRETIRPYDVCVRYAGDEFIIVLAGCGPEEAEAKRRELQRAVDAMKVEAPGGRPVEVRASASARRSTRRMAKPTRRCWRRRTAGCTTTRRRASGPTSGRDRRPR